MIDEILSDAAASMEKALASLKRDLGALRTGRASPALLENVRVEYYGSQMAVNQVATIQIPEARLIVLQPWDKAALDPLEKALLASGIGVTPTNDGKVIRLVLPPLTEDRRKDLVKQARKRAEEARVAIRGIRKDAKGMIDEYAAEERLPDDDVTRALDRLQALTDDFVAQADETTAHKEKEILEF